MLGRKKPLRRTALKRTAKPKRTLGEMIAVGLVNKASSFTTKPRKKLKPRSPRNKGGQIALFRKIWDSRPHKCEVCGIAIQEPTAANFSHLLPKGTYPDYKLDEKNVVIKCYLCHYAWHAVGPHVLSVMSPMWVPVCDRYYKLSLEANGLTRKP